jgi:hypothetical protein
MPSGDVETYHEDGQWKNTVEGNERASSTHPTKADAEAQGRSMAQDRGVEHVIKNMDGTISEKHTYPRSRDPRASEG